MTSQWLPPFLPIFHAPLDVQIPKNAGIAAVVQKQVATAVIICVAPGSYVFRQINRRRRDLRRLYLDEQYEAFRANRVIGLCEQVPRLTSRTSLSRQ